MTWRTPRFTDPFYRDDTDEVFVGRTYIYYWVERRRHVRRFRYSDAQCTVAKAQRQPRTGQELTQLFFNKRMSERFEHSRPAPRNPAAPERRWRPRGRLIIIRASTLDVNQLTLVYRRLSPGFPADAQLGSHFTAVRRVEQSLERQDLVLVDHPLPGHPAMSPLPHVHIIPRSAVPEEESMNKPHARRFGDELVVRRTTTECPKREGTMTARLWHVYQPGMTVGEYINQVAALTGDRRSGRETIQYDWDRGHIELERPDGTMVERPPEIYSPS